MGIELVEIKIMPPSGLMSEGATGWLKNGYGRVEPE